MTEKFTDESGFTWTLDELLADLDDGDHLYLTPMMCADLARLLRASTAKPEAREGMALLPIQPTPEMLRVGATHEWPAGYDRNGSHASGKYEEYTNGLRYAFGDFGCEFAALEVYEAMVRAYLEPQRGEG